MRRLRERSRNAGCGMSEPFSKHRGVPDALDLRNPDAQVSTEKSDPLAELARLVGREDPFRNLFPARDSGTAPARVDRPASGQVRSPLSEPFDTGSPSARATQPRAEHAPLLRGPDDFFRGSALNRGEDDDSAFHAPLGQVRREAFRLPVLPDADADAHGLDPATAPALNADLWAQGMPEPVSADPMDFVPAENIDTPQSTTRRTLVVLLAVLALTAGGLGASFLVRGGSAGGSGSSAPPTIMADTEPTKVQPPDTSNQSTGGDGNTALIEKSASDNVSNAKITDTQERPVDLGELPKAAPAAAPAPTAQPDDGRVAVSTAPAGTNASAFPEPRKVKTIMIRPDGSVVGEDPTAAAAIPAAGAVPAFASNPAPAVSQDEPVARPATPKATTRATSTPKSVSADGTAVAKPKVAHVAPKPKPAPPAPAPVAEAEATPDETATTAAPSAPAAAASGAFAVQLAAPSSEQEAKDASSRLQKKFASELDGLTPSIRKAEKGDKSVYRVRVGNLSQDDAKALCAKLQSGGGSCFVVRN